MIESKFQTVAADDIVDWGWDSFRLVGELEAVRWETIEGLEDRHRADPQAWGAVLMDHPQSWRLIVDAPEQVQGFWHFVSLYREAYEQVKLGAFVSTDLNSEMLHPLTPGQHDIYLVSCCIRPSSRSISAAIDLIGSFWTTLIEMAASGVLIGEICTNAFTRQGKLMAQTAGLEYVRDHEIAGQIYAAQMQDLMKRPRVRNSASHLMRQLREFY